MRVAQITVVIAGSYDEFRRYCLDQPDVGDPASPGRIRAAGYVYAHNRLDVYGYRGARFVTIGTGVGTEAWETAKAMGMLP